MGAYSRLGAYTRWALIRGWALIRINTVYHCHFYFCYDHNIRGGEGKFWQDLAWFVSTFFESRNFLPKSLRLGFLTRMSASRQVSDFTIHHP